MLGVSGLPGSSGDGAAAPRPQEHGGSGGETDGAGPSTGGFSEEEKGRAEEGDRSSAGNRWPKQETLALLKIRSDMDVAFRDSSLKGPLWEEVSRKLAELGYHRSAKKCKEKFENVYKYHKRTKEGRASKGDGKNYPFFDQLEAFENHPSHPLPSPSKPQIPAMAMATAMVEMSRTNPPVVSQITSTVPSATNPIMVSQSTVTPSSVNSTSPLSQPLRPPPPPLSTAAATTTTNPKKPYGRNVIGSLHPNVMLNSTSSSTSSDLEPRRRLRRKRKWEDLLERVMNEVIHKQEELQRKFLEVLEKRERDWIEKEEAWRVQEMARMNREHELLVQERSMAAAKDASLIAFLQKISQQQQNPNSSQMQMLLQVQANPVPPQLPPPPQPPSPPRQPPPPPPSPPTLDNRKTENFTPNSSSRWPKAEVQALISLRADLDLKYLENGPKGPLWEEMSMGMRKLGYDRSAKRCKEKWENINKYFKKVKESNKKRPEDSKTCPYFHQLEALYKEKNKVDASFNHGSALNKVENQMAPIMVRPEQQWPLPVEEHRPEAVMEDRENEDVDQNNDEEEDIEDDEDEEDGGGGGGYEIVTSKASSVATVE
ncbi:trihelix transcription factor DF1-like [Cornus florida]|uniref:trihelix transcription factor DF1-like n=1 Tax=Cornus florida TaxID=4283 RepID=UPI0028A15A7B|nr:trihelix transcription factor DF1-like [Cornus florida]